MYRNSFDFIQGNPNISYFKHYNAKQISNIRNISDDNIDIKLDDETMKIIDDLSEEKNAHPMDIWHESERKAYEDFAKMECPPNDEDEINELNIIDIINNIISGEKIYYVKENGDDSNLFVTPNTFCNKLRKWSRSYVIVTPLSEFDKKSIRNVMIKIPTHWCTIWVHTKEYKYGLNIIVNANKNVMFVIVTTYSICDHVTQLKLVNKNQAKQIKKLIKSIDKKKLTTEWFRPI
jgi:hypothetical protein